MPIPAISSLRSKEIPGERDACFAWGAGFPCDERLGFSGAFLVVVGLRLEALLGWRVVLEGVLSVEALLDLFFVLVVPFIGDVWFFLLAMDFNEWSQVYGVRIIIAQMVLFIFLRGEYENMFLRGLLIR
jgi:hypothetical protein